MTRKRASEKSHIGSCLYGIYQFHAFEKAKERKQVKATPENVLKAKVIVQQKRELGLVVPARYQAGMPSKRISIFFL